MTITISAATLGNISGGPSSIKLSDLADVGIASPQNGQYLTYNSALSEWRNTSVSGEIYDYLATSIIGLDGVIVTATPGPNTIALSLGNITVDSVVSAGTIAGSNLSGTNTGDQTITLTGDINGSGRGTFATTLSTVNTAPQTNAFRKITVNAKGLVTATTAVSSADITTSLGYTPVNRAGDTMSGALILNADPGVALGAVTKQYVDNVAAGLNAHIAVSTSTTTTLASSSGGTIFYTNGAAGVGATLTTTGNFNTIGGYSVATGDRVLVKDETTTANNGVYIKTSATVLTRASDFDNSPAAEVVAGDFVYVQQGALNGTQWVLVTPGVITIGVTGLVFTQLSGAGTYIAGAGIDISANLISNTGVRSLVAGSNISLSSGTGNVTIGVTNSPTLIGTNFSGIPNAALTNSSVTIGTTATALGASSTTLAGLTSVTATGFTGALTGNASTATTATNATITDDVTTNANEFIVWSPTATGANGLRVSSTKLLFNPATGVLTSTAFNSTSTARVKSAITDLSPGYLEKFSMLKPREYDRTDYVGHEFGFIAEEMNQVYPEIVGKDNEGFPSGIDYSKLATILTAKVQAQQSVIDQLQAQMAIVMELLKGIR